MDRDALLLEVQLDLGLRSEFEAKLRKALVAFRADPKPGVVAISVSLDLRPLTG